MLTTLRPGCAFNHCNLFGAHSIAATLSSRATVFLILLRIRVLSQITVSKFKLRDHRVGSGFRGSLRIGSDFIFSLIRRWILLSHDHLLAWIFSLISIDSTRIETIDCLKSTIHYESIARLFLLIIGGVKRWLGLGDFTK